MECLSLRSFVDLRSVWVLIKESQKNAKKRKRKTSWALMEREEKNSLTKSSLASVTLKWTVFKKQLVKIQRRPGYNSLNFVEQKWKIWHLVCSLRVQCTSRSSFFSRSLLSAVPFYWNSKGKESDRKLVDLFLFNCFNVLTDTFQKNQCDSEPQMEIALILFEEPNWSLQVNDFQKKSTQWNFDMICL